MTTEADALLGYYQAELAALRNDGQEFAREHPRVARRLELALDESPDPHVERLIESVAFLTARIRRALDDELPETAAAMLGTLYPHLTAPVPSTTIARFTPDPAQGKLTTGRTIAKHTPLFAQTTEGAPCRFRTCYPVTLWPLSVTYAAFESCDRWSHPRAETALRIRLADGGDPPCAPETLRFYLNADLRSAATLFELLFGSALAVYAVPGESEPVELAPGALRLVGFGRDEEVLPHAPNAHPGYRLVQEYFAVPRKFFFFDVAGLDAAAPAATRDLVVLLDRKAPEWLSVDATTFALGCTPVVNLFRRATEPVRLDHRAPEYRLVPDARRERSTEIHTVLEVFATAVGEAESKPVAPFHGVRHGGRERCFWQARRVPTGRRDLPGTEVRLAFVDLDLDPTLPEGRMVWARALCTNRRLAEQLPEGEVLQIEEAAPLERITVLHPPTPQRDPPLSGATLWRLVSHLSLNHLSLVDDGGGEALEALREILRLYGAFGSDAAEAQVAGLRALSARRVVRRAGEGAWRGLCRGTEVELVFDEARFAGTSAFLLGAVLARFLALHASVNSFTQTRVRSVQRSGTWKLWPPAAGEQPVL